jgi:catechol 2,3-dioxygenase-like lactoylglutathione lyase family enzyme
LNGRLRRYATTSKRNNAWSRGPLSGRTGSEHGHGRIELATFHAPSGPGGDRHAPANTPGIRHITFAVDDIDAVVARLRARSAELVGGVERYEDIYRLCYVRGPEGIILELAEQLQMGRQVTEPPPICLRRNHAEQFEK